MAVVGISNIVVPPRGAHDHTVRGVLARGQVHPGARSYLPVRHPGPGPAPARPAPRRPAPWPQHRDVHLGLPGLPARRLRPDPGAAVGPAEGPRRGVLLGPQRGSGRHRGVRQPDGGPLPEAQVRRRARNVVRQGPRRRPHRRPLQARELRGGGEERRGAGPGRGRSTLEVVDPAEPLRGRALRRVHAHALSGQRAGDPRPGPARLHALAHVGTLGRGQDRHQRGRRDRHRGGGRGAGEPDHPGGGARRQALPAPDQREPDPALRPRHGAHDPRGAARAGAALRLREQAQPDHGADSERVARHPHQRQDLLRRAPGPDRARPRRGRAPPLRHPDPQDGHAVPDGAPRRPRVRAGPAGDPGRRGEAVVPRDVRQGHPLRHDRPAAGGGQGRRGGPAAAPAGRRARLGPGGPRDRPAARAPDPDRLGGGAHPAPGRAEAPAEAVHPGPLRLLLLGLPAQPLHRDPGGQRGLRRHRLPRHGDGHGSGHHRGDPHGRGGRAVGRHRALHRDHRTSSRTSATGRSSTRAASRSTTRSPRA